MTAEDRPSEGVEGGAAGLSNRSSAQASAVAIVDYMATLGELLDLREQHEHQIAQHKRALAAHEEAFAVRLNDIRAKLPGDKAAALDAFLSRHLPEACGPSTSPTTRAGSPTADRALEGDGDAPLPDAEGDGDAPLPDAEGDGDAPLPDAEGDGPPLLRRYVPFYDRAKW